MSQIGLKPSWNFRKQLSNQECLARPVVGFARDAARYKHSIIRYPAHAGTARCPPPHAQRKRILTRVGQRVQSPSSTTRATPSGLCSTRRLPSTSRPGLSWPVPASSTARVGYQHSGFSVDAGVCIEAHDRSALERLLRYCARPPFAMERLRKEGAALIPFVRRAFARPYCGRGAGFYAG